MQLLNSQEIKKQVALITQWNIDAGMLCKEIHFKSFRNAIDYINKIATVSEENQHHPIIINSYLSVVIKLTTNDVNGLTQKDFDLAKLIDQISL
jgi:4a-hydroxytetrahydrobiopterin dehydratase|tara:strand:- start:305 stop:586 length:282 start_codon:yes stop_codon:yes gene_type:complete